MTTADERGALESERDFLLESLDDLESERAAGGIDDESYRQLHDDYTARAAATIRALRDGVDARPRPPRDSKRTRVLWIAGIVVFGIVAGVVLALALGARQEGELASGNEPLTDNTNVTLEDRIERLEEQVAAEPENAGARVSLATFLEQSGDLAGALEQYDAVIEREPENAIALANSGRVLYLSANTVPGTEEAVNLVEAAKARLDQAIVADPELADARYYRAIVYVNELYDRNVAISDLQRYLVLAPDGQFADEARNLLADLDAPVEGSDAPPGTTVP
jgi:cytochrome c-type biogenesis protein CcmH/NrfG